MFSHQKLFNALTEAKFFRSFWDKRVLSDALIISENKKIEIYDRYSYQKVYWCITFQLRVFRCYNPANHILYKQIQIHLDIFWELSALKRLEDFIAFNLSIFIARLWFPHEISFNCQWYLLVWDNREDKQKAFPRRYKGQRVESNVLLIVDEIFRQHKLRLANYSSLLPHLIVIVKQNGKTKKIVFFLIFNIS